MCIIMQCAGFTMYIVRHHMPDMGMMLMLTKHNGNDLERRYYYYYYYYCAASLVFSVAQMPDCNVLVIKSEI